jgi:Raf kinase inhibitor-like YbhB/YbcL family protein
MNTRRVLISVLVGLSLLIAIPTVRAAEVSAHPGFRLSSSDLRKNEPIPQRFTFNSFGCTGENMSPQLQWSSPPAGTKSLAVIVHDPDAHTGVGGFTHWIVYNIPASVDALPTGAGTADGKQLPAGSVQPATSFGSPGWGGPCPPAGEKPHRYTFTIYALSTNRLDLPAGSSEAFIGFNIVGNSIGAATFTARYGR